jgi:cobalamin biosynthesis protein CobD/CbiB
MQARYQSKLRAGLVVGVVILIPVVLLAGMLGQVLLFLPVLEMLLGSVLVSTSLGWLPFSRGEFRKSSYLRELFDRPPPPVTL